MRLSLPARKSFPRSEHEAPDRTGQPESSGALPAARRPAVVVGLVLGLIALAYAWAIYLTATEGNRVPVRPPVATPGSESTPPPATGAATPPASASAAPAATEDALVAAARAVKPLADLETGDRVLYKGEVWYWRGWDARPELSWISAAPDHPDRLQVQTALLTPVEAAPDS
jgi:hypothetical protein